MTYQEAIYEAEYFIGNSFASAWEIYGCENRPDNYNEILKDFEDEFGNVWRDLKQSLITAYFEKPLGSESEDVEHFQHLINQAFDLSARDEKRFEMEEQA